MQVVLPDRETRASFEVCGEDRPLNDDEFFDFCMKNPNLRIERMRNGDVLIMPPAGNETSYRNNRISSYLFLWAEQDGRGVAFDSSTAFVLPSGATLGPDAAWMRKNKLEGVPELDKEKFGHYCPDFVIELRSPSNRIASLKAKMAEWINNGVQLGWLIDAGRQTVYIYRQGQPVEELRNASFIEGEGVVSGFRLDLQPLWRRL
jgi:Uma2 family endonuclease